MSQTLNINRWQRISKEIEEHADAYNAGSTFVTNSFESIKMQNSGRRKMVILKNSDTK